MSIQHWRTKKPPFFHEYLVILLDDGALCRVERMGEGSHRNAIKRIGCTAHDIIQWFSASEYEADLASKEPADLVWQIHFPRKFDLLDVLAVCFSIQRTSRCRPYTLQRYNCYFLCLTILAILARRVGEWEEIIDTEAAWSATTDDVIGRLGQIPCEGMDEYIGLGICAFLNPRHSNPRGLILDPLRSQLSSIAFERWRASVSETLWAKDLESATRKSLELCVNDAINAVLTSNPNDPEVANMRVVFAYQQLSEDLSDEDLPREFMEAITHEAVRGYFGYLQMVTKSAEVAYRLRKIEYGPALGYWMLAWSVACYYCCTVVAQGPKALLSRRHKITPVERLVAHCLAVTIVLN